MKLPIFQVDAFSSRQFRGNPAAVVVLDEWLEDRVLAAVAAENNLAETAFVIPRSSDVLPLRWFTPTVEVNLCGHATLATAHVLFNYYFPNLDTLRFATRSGQVAVARRGDLLCLDFPARPAKPVEITDALVSALGARPREALMARDILAIFDSEQEVLALRPDFPRIAALDCFAVIVSARGDSQIDSADFVSRFFAPGQGVPEDPVTGSAHCTLTPYWSAKLGKTSLVARQVSARGGDLRCEMNGDRVVIAGHTAEYLRGEITIDL